PDLALIASRDGPAAAAAVFTRNRFAAAPIIVAREHLAASGGRVRGVVANAGCANAGTGEDGIRAARRMAEAAAGHLGCEVEEVLPASTGLIGSRLAVEAIEATLPAIRLRSGRAAGTAVARAIMTTDTRPKQAAVRTELVPGQTVVVGGVAKGAGMIHPSMGTMLAFVTTDAAASPRLLDALLRPAVETTFNQVSVDGDESTNDLVLLLAGGLADNAPIEDPGDPRADALGAAVHAVCRRLARQIAADGEGARRRIDVSVRGAMNDVEARRLARAVAASNLVKAAVHGGDPNWGRILAVIGQHAAALEPARVCVSIGEELVFAGVPVAFSARAAARAMSRAAVRLSIDLQAGVGTGEAWGCDLTAEYVAINSEYTT
ncbi:MAG: bifunctional glutamate N-acetyltransferase/amino-acid acetyltransferase ArgJ, partial [Candidatus Limnocylindria bacterium]